MSFSLCFQIQFLFNFDAGFYSLLDFIEKQEHIICFLILCVFVYAYPHSRTQYIHYQLIQLHGQIVQQIPVSLKWNLMNSKWKFVRQHRLCFLPIEYQETFDIFFLVYITCSLNRSIFKYLETNYKQHVTLQYELNIRLAYFFSNYKMYQY